MMPINPDEPVTYLTIDGQEQPSTGIRLRQVFGEMLIHRPQDLYVAPVDRGRNLQNMIRARLRAERFDEDECNEWAFRDWRQWLAYPHDKFDETRDLEMCQRVVETALAYRNTGMPIDEAVAWTVRSVGSNLAVYNRRRGWSPAAYSSLVSLCLADGTRSPEGRQPHENAWVDAPIPAWRALRYLRAGLTLAEATEQEQRRNAGGDVDATIDTLIGLREKR